MEVVVAVDCSSHMVDQEEEDLEDSIPDIAAGNVDLVVVVVGVVGGNPVRDILRVDVAVVVVGVLFGGVEAWRIQDEVVGIGVVDHPIGIVEEEVDDFASHVVVEEVAAVAAGEEVVDVVGWAAAAAGLEVVEQPEVAAVAVPEVAASETAVAAAAAAAVKEVVLADLAVQAALDFLPGVEESFAQEPSVEEAAAVVAFPIAVVAAETEELPIAAADVIAVQETAVVAAAAAVEVAAAVDFDLAFRMEYVHKTQVAVAVHAAYSAS